MVCIVRQTVVCICMGSWLLCSNWCLAQTEPAAPPDAARAEAEKRELLERILRNTAGARDKLTDKVTGPETQKLQQDVVVDLETLIELLKKAPPPPPKKNDDDSSSSSSDSDSENQDPQQKSQDESESKPSRKPKSKGTGDGRDRNQAEGSEERHGESRDAKQKADRKLRLENDIWGHLPPALREQLLNTYGERMLPQYEEFVRKFYEALSEPKRPRSGNSASP